MDLLVISKCTDLTIDILEQGANFEDLSHAALILVTDNPAERDVRGCRRWFTGIDFGTAASISKLAGNWYITPEPAHYDVPNEVFHQGKRGERWQAGARRVCPGEK
jgi:hypothetical protein